MIEDDDRKIEVPLAYRLRLRLGRPFGLRWVPDNHLGVIYQMGLYHSLRGPGFFRINPLTETVKDIISVKPDFISTPIPSLQTRDALQLGLRVALAYIFDPRPLPRDKVVIFVEWPRQIHRAIVSDHATEALQGIVPKFYAEQICRGEAFETIGKDLMTQLTKRLGSLAMKPIFVMVLEVMVPPALQESFTAVVKRAVYTQDLSQYESFELNQAQRRELYETLSNMPGGSIRYLNLSAPEATSPSRPADETPSRRVVRGTATALPPSPEPDTDAEPPQRPGISPKSHL